ncbi:MAG: ABC transporter substrate-binding protein, partial [Dethiobacter sp.]|nr:ABC transporter substrate-binding protein [Dethiobacter sp.]
MFNKKYLFLLSAVLVIALLLFVTGCPPGEEPVEEELTVEHTIVALLGLTGALSGSAETASVSMKLAEADINAWLQENEREWRLKLVIEDEANDPTTALRKMTTWFGEGVKIFAGPQTSGSSREMLAFANANEILFVSQSATSPALALPGDFLYRFVAADDVQGPAIAAMLQEAGIKHVIFTWRGDTWGDGLHTATTTSIEKVGGIEIFEQELR